MVRTQSRFAALFKQPGKRRNLHTGMAAGRARYPGGVTGVAIWLGSGAGPCATRWAELSTSVAAVIAARKVVDIAIPRISWATELSSSALEHLEDDGGIALHTDFSLRLLRYVCSQRSAVSRAGRSPTRAPARRSYLRPRSQCAQAHPRGAGPVAPTCSVEQRASIHHQSGKPASRRPCSYRATSSDRRSVA
jgi:hypothetical protein